MEKKERKLMTMTELLDSKRIYWVRSLPTLKKWVFRDMERRNILRTEMRKNKGRGSRYYFTPAYVEDYVNAFHRGELDIGTRYENTSQPDIPGRS